MIIRPTVDQDEIKKILFHPDIYPDTSAGYELDFDSTVFPIDNVLYIGGYDEQIFALSCIHPFMDGFKYHPYVLPEYRLKYGRDFVKQTVSMVKCPVYVEIPKKRKDLVNLAIKNGFDSVANNKDLSNKVLMRLL